MELISCKNWGHHHRFPGSFLLQVNDFASNVFGTKRHIGNWNSSSKTTLLVSPQATKIWWILAHKRRKSHTPFYPPSALRILGNCLNGQTSGCYFTVLPQVAAFKYTDLRMNVFCCGSSVCSWNSLLLSLWTDKNTPKCLGHIFYESQSILIKFGMRCPE